MNTVRAIIRFVRQCAAEMVQRFVLAYYGFDFWRIRQACRSCGKSVWRRVLTSGYNAYCERHGAYIPLGVDFSGQPCFPHGIFGVFISTGAKIGKDAVIFQQVTIGSNTLADHGGSQGLSPVLGDGVYIGTGAKIIGGVTIGNGVRVGANCCVYGDVPDNSVVVASPMRVILRDKKMDNRFFSKEDGRTLFWQNGAWHEET